MVVPGCFDLNALALFASSFGCCGAADVRTSVATIQLSRRQQPAQNSPATIVTSAVSTICDVDMPDVRTRIEMR
jgi:hypothetical protein